MPSRKAMEVINKFERYGKVTKEELSNLTTIEYMQVLYHYKDTVDYEKFRQLQLFQANNPDVNLA